MFNWHEEACRSPDIKFSGGMGIPTCASCGSSALLEDDTESLSHKASSVPASTDRFELIWPSSLPFVDEMSQGDATLKRKRSFLFHVSESIEALDSNLPKKATKKRETISRQDPGGIDMSHLDMRATSKREPTADSPIASKTTYKSLVAGKIRLLKLTKGDYHEPIRGELQVTDLAHKPDYEALSYTWADETEDSSKRERIYIGGRWDILPITRNCFNALRRLRYSGRPRTLWVDAICINQDDVAERSHQVSIMQIIYAIASRVIVYLGEETNDSNATISSPWNFDQWNQCSERSLTACGDLTKKSYFKRVWVIQEIAAAKNIWVLFGTRGNRWPDFLDQVEALAERKRQWRRLHRGVPSWSSRTATDGPKQRHRQQNWFHLLPHGKLLELEELPRLLHATIQCQATDPRDKLYALLGLFQGASQAHLTADYSLSVAQVFSGLTAYLLSKSSAFLLPLFTALQPGLRNSFPSWTVDWSSATNLDCMRPYLAEVHPKRPNEDDSHNVPYMPRFYRNGSFVLQGRLISHLSSCIFDSKCQKGPPGALKGIVYRRPGVQVTQYERDSMPGWTEPTDELIQIKGLPSLAIALRPVMNAPKTYRFVAIFEQPKPDWLCDSISLIDRTTLLLFSTWRFILGENRDHELWFNTNSWSVWDDLKAACLRLKKFCYLQDKTGQLLDSLLDSKDEEQASSSGKIQEAVRQLSKDFEQSFPEDEELEYDITRGMYNLKTVASQITGKKGCEETKRHYEDPWAYLGQNFTRGGVCVLPYTSWATVSGLAKYAEWKTEGSHGSLHDVETLFETVNHPKSQEAIDYGRFIAPVGWEWGAFGGIPEAQDMTAMRSNPGTHERAFSWSPEYFEDADLKVFLNDFGLLCRYDFMPEILPNRSLEDFAKALLGQSLDQKLVLFDLMIRRFSHGKKIKRFKSLHRDVLLPWLQDSLNLEPRIPHTAEGIDGTEKKSHKNAHLETWAADFIRSWTLLTVGSDRVSHLEPEDLPLENTEEPPEQEHSYLAAARAKWAPLFDLVRETEARLLPLERARTDTNDTHDEFMDGVPWEDITIV